MAQLPLAHMFDPGLGLRRASTHHCRDQQIGNHYSHDIVLLIGFDVLKVWRFLGKIPQKQCGISAEFKIPH